MQKSSKRHHWWPVALQSYWEDKKGNVSWIEPTGKIETKRVANRKIGLKIHGHTALQGSPFETNFENEFDIDNEIHDVIQHLTALRPFGRKPIEFLQLFRLFFDRDRSLRHICNFYQLDDELHRKTLLLILSLLIRSPARRDVYERYPEIMGARRNEEVGKMNMRETYSVAKEFTKNGNLLNHYFVLLHSPIKKFICGDGSLDWLTENLQTAQIHGKALVPLTPNLCIYFCTNWSVSLKPNCALMTATPWMVDWINDVTQIYSKHRLFFVGKQPQLNEHFRKWEFLVHENREDALIEILDEVIGIKPENTLSAEWRGL